MKLEKAAEVRAENTKSKTRKKEREEFGRKYSEKQEEYRMTKGRTKWNETEGKYTEWDTGIAVKKRRRKLEE